MGESTNTDGYEGDKYDLEWQSRVKDYEVNIMTDKPGNI
jgi:hypothetical protein